MSESLYEPTPADRPFQGMDVERVRKEFAGELAAALVGKADNLELDVVRRFGQGTLIPTLSGKEFALIDELIGRVEDPNLRASLQEHYGGIQSQDVDLLTN